MQIKLRVSQAHEQRIVQELQEKNIGISEDSTLVLIEETEEEQFFVKGGNETVVVSFVDITYIESIGHDVFIHVGKAQYKVEKRLYQLERELPEERFIRISNSVIIARNAIQKIRPAPSCKFILTLKSGDVVDVTRTYYYKFKEYFGI